MASSGVAWRRFPIADMGVPDAAFAAAWGEQGADVTETLRSGGRIAMHCVGGLGRTGTIAARLLVEFGLDPEAAIDAVRAARPGTIETPAQLAFVRRRGPLAQAGNRGRSPA
ncbi:MAG: hypothetical protein FJX57_09355 [Alphaproteobacteria bacterium]|nr:hypothetical protein [Alphaproteobacteria bacterium]